MSNELKQLMKAAEHQGWRVEHRSKHIMFIPKDKTKSIVVSSATPGDLRALDNLRSQLRRSGLVFIGKKGSFSKLLSGGQHDPAE